MSTTAAGEAGPARAAPAKARRSCVLRTYRYYGHHVGDINRAYYRSKEEERSGRRSVTRSSCSASRSWPRAWSTRWCSTRIEEEVRTQIDEGVQFALDAPYPQPKR